MTELITNSPTSTVLLMGFMMGMLHATDVDHLLTVSSLASTTKGRWKALKISCGWAAGHCLMLLMLGCMIFLFKFKISDQTSYFAELGVALLLFYMGGYILFRLIYKQHLHIHQHDNKKPHLHWHSHPSNELLLHSHQHKHDKKSFLIGGLHGLAGSAPVLALIPLLKLNAGIEALLYLLLFSVGVAVSMMICAGVFSGMMSYAKSYSVLIHQRFQYALGVAAMFCGIFFFAKTL